MSQEARTVAMEQPETAHAPHIHILVGRVGAEQAQSTEILGKTRLTDSGRTTTILSQSGCMWGSRKERHAEVE